jgi:hypothetical protein
MDLYLGKNLVTGCTLTPDGVLAYTALRWIMNENIPLYNKSATIECVSVNKMAYTLISNQDKYEKSLLDALQRGIYELVNADVLTIVKDFSTKASYEYLLDFSKLYLDTQSENFIIIHSDEVVRLLTCGELMKKKISMMKYYIALISTFNWSKSMRTLPDLPNLQGKIGSMSMEYIAAQADISQRTCMRYNDVLADMKMIYVYKSNDKVRDGDRLKQIKNCYSRYADKDSCEAYASNYENWYGSQHKILITRKNKEQADNSRRLAAIYNRICEGYADNYDEATIKQVYKYIVNKNKSLQNNIDEKYEQPYYQKDGKLSYSDDEWVKKLKSQIRDVSIFEQFEYLQPNKNADNWGEPDAMDYSVEEILNMPTIGDVQSEPTQRQFSWEGDMFDVEGLTWDDDNEYADLY